MIKNCKETLLGEGRKLVSLWLCSLALAACNAKDAMSKEELCQFLKDLAHKYYEDKLNDKAHPKCPKRQVSKLVLLSQ